MVPAGRASLGQTRIASLRFGLVLTSCGVPREARPAVPVWWFLKRKPPSRFVRCKKNLSSRRLCNRIPTAIAKKETVVEQSSQKSLYLNIARVILNIVVPLGTLALLTSGGFVFAKNDAMLTLWWVALSIIYLLIVFWARYISRCQRPL